MPRDTSRDGPFCSSNDQFAQTPDAMKLYLSERFGKMRDMAPVGPTIDSLAAETKWGDLNYVNPPFNVIGKWLDKAVEQYLTRGCGTVFLIPMRPHRLYFQKHVKHYSFIEYLAEGVAFKGYKRIIPHAMCLLGIGVPPVAASPGIVPFGRLYLHGSASKHTISGMAEKVRKDFGVDDDIKMCMSVNDIPVKNYAVALIYTNMRKIKDDLTKYTVVVPHQLYRDGDDGKPMGRLFNGSVVLVDAGSNEPTASGYSIVKHAFVNKEFIN
jgi:hypothetical protein